jgi:hypothetical protein
MSSKNLQILIREILQEYTVNPASTLYHRSSHDFKVGDTLTAQMDPKTGQHWLASKETERTLERIRKESYPDLPSRLNCVYLSFVPRSRFLNKGKLYAVEPLGKTHCVNSQIIDELAETRYPSYALMEEYWKGSDPYRSNINDLEVLVTSARITEVVEEDNSKRLNRGDTIEFLEGAPIIDAAIDYYWSNPKYEKAAPKPYTYLADGNSSSAIDVAMAACRDTPGLQILDEPDMELSEKNSSAKIRVRLGPEFVGKFRTFQVGDPGKKTSFNPLSATISVSPTSPGMRISGDQVGKLLKAFRKGLVKRV